MTGSPAAATGGKELGEAREAAAAKAAGAPVPERDGPSQSADRVTSASLNGSGDTVTEWDPRLG